MSLKQSKQHQPMVMQPKIQQLYDKFEQLKVRIGNSITKCQTPTKKNNRSIKQAKMFSKNSKNNGISIQNPLQFNYSERQILKSNVLSLIHRQSLRLQQKFINKIINLQEKLQYAQAQLTNLKVNYRIKIVNKAKQQLLQQKHNKSVSTILGTRSNKISFILNELSISQSTVTSQSLSKQIYQELRAVQKTISQKQSQIKQCQLHSKQLQQSIIEKQKLLKKREEIIDDLKKQLQQKLKLINEPNSQTRQIHELFKYNNTLIRRNAKNQQKLQLQSSQIQVYKNKTTQLEDKIRRLQTENNGHKQQILKLNQIYGKYSTLIQQNIQLKRVNSQNEQNKSIDYILMQSQRKEKSIIQSQRKQKIMTKSQIISSNQFETFKQQRQLQQKQQELQLINKYNMHLKQKNNLFQTHIKERSQKQLIISHQFKDQIKKMEYQLKTLDECAVYAFNNISIPKQKLDLLANYLKFPVEYKKTGKYFS